jgi:hypothetical protein
VRKKKLYPMIRQAPNEEQSEDRLETTNIRPSGGQPPAGLSATQELATLRAQLVLPVTTTGSATPSFVCPTVILA